MKIAIITPYCGEPLETIERCSQSVTAQNVSATHVLVSDGDARSEIQALPGQHIRLARAHRDNGNTARGIGAISALNRGFDAFAFLDADNWFAPDHLESLLAVVKTTGAAVAFSDRQIVLSTGEICSREDDDVVAREAVDTSCMFITREAAFLLPVWCMMEPNLSPICDRVMFAAIRAQAVPHAWSGQKTVFYESRWAKHFALMGKHAPHDAHHTPWERIRATYDQERHRERLLFDPFSAGRPF